MNDVRALQYLGISLLMGCSVGFIFTIVFMLVLSFSGVQAVYALGFFSSLALIGFLIVKFDWREKEAVSNEEISK